MQTPYSNRVVMLMPFVGSRRPGIVRRALGLLYGFTRPVPSVRPEPLPSLPSRTSPRRNSRALTPSPLTSNRDGTSRVQRARDRAQRSPVSRLNRLASWRPQPRPTRSWVLDLDEDFLWDSHNQPPSPRYFARIQNLPSIEMGERSTPSATPPRDATVGSPPQSSGIFMDRNTIRRHISPTPQGRGGRVQDTNENITAATIQGSSERGASPPLAIEHPGDGPIVGAGPDGDRQIAIPPWQWIPQDNEHYQAFLRDDRDRVNQGDTARLAAHRALNALIDTDAGDAIMMDLYQLLRARYEWGLTHDYRFPQHAPGYCLLPAPVGTPPNQRYRPYYGGAGTPPGYLNRAQAVRPESDEMYRGASADSSPWFSDSRPDPNLLKRANILRSWGSWNGGANRGNQDFDLYASPRDGGEQPGSDEQESQTSLDQRRELLREPEGGIQLGRGDSVSTFNLPSASRPGQRTPRQSILLGDDTARGSRQGALLTTGTGPGNQRGRRASGASSLGRRELPPEWQRGSENGSQLSTGSDNASQLLRGSTSNARTQMSAERLRFSNARGIGISLTGPQVADAQTTGNQVTGSQNNDYQATGNQQTTGNQGMGEQATGPQDTGTHVTPTRAQYQNMTAQQLRDEITARGGDPNAFRQRKADLAQALLEYDARGNHGNGAQPRCRATSVPPHRTLSPRKLRPRDDTGKATKR